MAILDYILGKHRCILCGRSVSPEDDPDVAILRLQSADGTEDLYLCKKCTEECVEKVAEDVDDEDGVVVEKDESI